MTHELQNVPPLPSDFSDRVLTFNLMLSGKDKIAVRSCEVIGRSFRNRISFGEANDLDTVLVHRLAATIRSCLARLPDGAHVLALPDFLLEIQGLALSGVHVMVMEVKEGVRNAIFRFKEFVGEVDVAFRDGVGLRTPLSSYSERLAVNVLSDICLPILNMAREMEFAHLEEGRPLPPALVDRAREFEFQTELLKRFIFNAGLRLEAEAPPAVSEMTVRRLTVSE